MWNTLNKYKENTLQMQTKRKIEMKCFMLRIIIYVLKYSRFSGKINFFKVLIKANQNLVHLIVWTFWA